jgi:hypothetical protein
MENSFDVTFILLLNPNLTTSKKNSVLDPCSFLKFHCVRQRIRVPHYCLHCLWSLLKLYCHVYQWLKRGFGLMNRFIGSSLVVTTISFYTLKVTVTIAHKFFNVCYTSQLNPHNSFPWRLRVLDSRLLSYDWLRTTFTVPYKPSARTS